MHYLIEFLLAAAIGLVFHFGLHLEKEAYTVFGLGILMTLAVHLIVRRIQETELKFGRIYGQSHRLDMLLHETHDPEAVRRGHALMDTMEKVMKILSRGDIPLTEGEYYYEAGRCLKACQKELKAVNSIEITDWMGKVQKRNYYRDQIQAKNSGIRIRRIFVIQSRDLSNPDILETIRNQQKDGIDVRLVLYDEMNFSWTEQIELPINFVLFDQDTLIIRNPLFGLYYGKKTASTGEILRYKRLFSILQQHSRTLDELLTNQIQGEPSKPLERLESDIEI